ncbi:hypothetical protein CAEBREN_22746 [Caenorhabditis brenneri]|uniref:Uncharacterized protein n=1 Tax=Caenorhabditis brenneri TaxID=135651 RepID=G0NEW9_CAEBE|nr:hypothetical protein CAEBREN_22746 [Caenorhabditis brenneri]
MKETASNWKMCRVLNWESEVKEGLQVLAQYCPQEWAQQRQVTTRFSVFPPSLLAFQEVIDTRAKYHCDAYEKITY